jgi:hypothetical protein
MVSEGHCFGSFLENSELLLLQKHHREVVVCFILGTPKFQL